MKKLFSHLGLTLCTAACLLAVVSCSKKHKSQIPAQLSAAQYLQLAETAKPALKPLYKFAAANKYIEQQKPELAKNVLRQINPQLTPEQAVEKRLIEAKLALLEDLPKRTLTILNQIISDNTILSDEQQVTLHTLLANTYEAVGDTLASVEQRSQLQSLIKDPQIQRSNLIAIWHSLQSLSAKQLNQFINTTATTNLQGWLTLALITKQSQTPDQLIKNLRQWQEKYPDHAAISLLPKNIADEVGQTTATKSIALLLPLHGRFGTTGESIRNGFLAAYYAAEKKQINIPHLKIYDTSKKDITTLYQQAAANGANLIIGPLRKHNLQKLVDDDAINTQTIALNTLYDAPPKNQKLIQFGLSPLDEAQQAAERAWKQGIRRVLIITTSSQWGQRITDIFRRSWTNLGGEIVDQLNIAPSQNTTTAVGDALNINYSNQDYKNLKKTLATHMRFVPRRRKDIDMVYLVTQPTLARQVVPMLKYFYAGDVPVYSLSQVYSGINNTRIDRDLNGVYFCDMPWVLDPNHEPQYLQDLRKQIKTVWPESYSRHKKLYALGVDAYQVSAKLQQMQALPQFAISGATGDLYLDQARHVYRKLYWSRFRDGSPMLIK